MFCLFATYFDELTKPSLLKLQAKASNCDRFILGGRHVTNVEEIRAIQWQSWTCVLGSEVNGMWPKYSQINDVNAVNASITYDTLATGDDFGLVKLFRFPCIKKG